MLSNDGNIFGLMTPTRYVLPCCAMMRDHGTASPHEGRRHDSCFGLKISSLAGGHSPNGPTNFRSRQFMSRPCTVSVWQRFLYWFKGSLFSHTSKLNERFFHSNNVVRCRAIQPTYLPHLPKAFLTKVEKLSSAKIVQKSHKDAILNVADTH